jgi:2-polyprenyl-3-methyl-5-hydroxy-6-metoxy-1,4-benzoquinol methylase
MHGEATFVASLGGRSVLDAGCGTGRVGIELARRGFDVVGLDADPGMLSAARAKAPDLEWVEGDLSTFELPAVEPEPEPDGRRRFDTIVMAGNVMIFVVRGTEGAILQRLAAHTRPGGALVAGFQVVQGRLSLDHYDELATAAGLTLAQRFATWDRQPWTPGSDFAVSVHRPAG